MNHTFQFVSKRYPTQPGCYLMKDGRGTVLYVGKAKNLRRRLASYFQKRHRRRKTKQLVQRIRDIELIIVRNETESLLLENNLIKHYQPHFNRMLKAAGSGYSYIVLTDEVVPRFIAFNPRRRKRRGLQLPALPPFTQRFGPFASRRFRDAVLAFVNDHYQLRTCDPLPHDVCLRYHMHKCSGICEQRLSAQQYAADVERAVRFFTHRHTQMMREIKTEMMRCADALQFERAQWLKEQLRILEQALEQQVVERDEAHDQHVVYFGDEAATIARVDCGTLKQVDLYPLAENRAQFLLSYYADAAPPEIIINQLNEHQTVAQTLRERHGREIKLTRPRNGAKYKLLKICALNYEYRITQKNPV